MPTINEILGPQKAPTITDLLSPPQAPTIGDLLDTETSQARAEALEQPGFAIPLLKDEVRDEDGRPGTLFPTVTVTDGQNTFDVIGRPEDSHIKKSGLKVVGPGKGKFRPRSVALDHQGDFDFTETAKDAARGGARGTAALAQFFVDAPQALGRLMAGQGLAAAGEAFSERGTISGAVNSLVQKPTTGLGEFVQAVAPLVPGTGLITGIFKGVARMGDRGVKLTKRLTFPEKLINDVQDAVVVSVARGEEPGAALAEAIAQTGIRSPGQYLELLQKTGLKPTIPSTPETAAAIIKGSDLFHLEERGRAMTSLAKIFQPAYDRVRDLSPRLFGKLREMEFRVRAMEEQFLNEGEPLFKAFKALSKEDKVVAKGALLDGDFATAGRVLGDDIVGAWKVQADRNYELIKSVYGDKAPPKVEFYFPRIISDKAGLLRTVGRKERSFIEQALKEARIKNKGNKLTQSEESQVITAAIFRRKDAQIAAPTYAHARRQDRIPDALKPFYADPVQAGHIHLRKLAKDLNLRTFLGKNIVQTKKATINIDKSAGSILAEDKALTARPWAAQEVKEILKARFEMGEVPPSAIVQFVRNVTYSGTLGNIFAKLTQLQDIGMAMSRSGFINTIKSLGPSGGKRVFAADVAVTKVAEELLQSPVRSARVMETILKTSGFNKFDRMGKSVILTGAYRKLARNAATEEGQLKIMADWGPIHGRKETRHLIQELQSGKMTDRVKAHLFNELADVQPISLGEVPLAYLQNPNGRVFYTLNTFAIRQLSAVLRAARDDWRVGRIKGAKTLAHYTIIMGSTGLTVDQVKAMIKGETLSVAELPMEFGAQILRNFLASRYMVGVARDKGLGTAIIDRVTPPFMDIMDAVGQDMWNLAQGDPTAKSLKYAPYINPLYWWIGPGGDTIARRESKRNKKGALTF